MMHMLNQGSKESVVVKYKDGIYDWKLWKALKTTGISKIESGWSCKDCLKTKFQAITSKSQFRSILQKRSS